MMLRALPKYISFHATIIVRDNIPHSDNRPEIKAGKLLSGCLIDVSRRFSENLKFPLNRTNAQSVHGEAFLGLTTGKIGVWGATEQKTGLRNDRYSSSGASGLRRGRN